MFLKAHNIKVFGQCKKMEDSAIAYTGRCKTSEMAVRLRLKVFLRINCHFSKIQNKWYRIVHDCIKVMLEIEDALTKSQNKVQNYRSNWFQFFPPFLTNILFKILPPSFYWQCFQTPATQLSSVISTSSSRGVQQRDTLIYVSCSNFSTTMTLVIWKLLSIWKSAFWMSFQTIQETSAKE